MRPSSRRRAPRMKAKDIAQHGGELAISFAGTTIATFPRFLLPRPRGLLVDRPDMLADDTACSWIQMPAPDVLHAVMICPFV